MRQREILVKCDVSCSGCLKPFLEGDNRYEITMGKHFSAPRVTLCTQCIENLKESIEDK